MCSVRLGRSILRFILRTNIRILSLPNIIILNRIILNLILHLIILSIIILQLSILKSPSSK